MLCLAYTSQWPHNECNGVSNYRRLDYLLNRYLGADQTKHQSSALLASVRGIRQWPVDSPHNGPVAWNHLMTSSWAFCQICKIAAAHAPGMPGTFSPPPRESDPDMHHGTCVTHVPWCMPGSLTSGFLWNRRRGKTFPTFPAHAEPANLLIW